MLEDFIASVRQIAENRTVKPFFTLALPQIVAQSMELLKNEPAEIYVPFVLEAFRIAREESPRSPASYALREVAAAILRRKLPFSTEQAIRLIELASARMSDFPYASILKVAESVPMNPQLAEALKNLRPCITSYHGGPQMTALHLRIDKLLALAGGTPIEISIAPQGTWSQAVFDEVANSPEWMDVFRHILDLKQSEPSQKWRARSRTLIAAIGKEQFFQAATRWLQLGPSPQQSGVQLNGKESDYQKGFLWFLAESGDPELCRLVSRFAEASLKKIRMLGAVSQKVGNACVNVLAEMPGLEPVMQLSGLARRIRYDTAQRLIEQALEQAAQRAGVSRDQLEEMTVPDFGLDPGGTRTEQFGEYSAHLAIELSTSVRITWTDPENKSLKSVPAAVKQQHAEDLKALQSTAKEMERMLASHRIRVERLLLTQRAIPLDSWRAYYLDHPLMSDMSRRLIWQFDSPAGNSLGIWRANKIVDLRGSEIDFPAETTVRLWHPIESDVQTVFNWRCWLEDHQITQPFKQAHREVYLLTDAERQTGHFSNRFTGHILRQHQFQALCEQRGWKFRLMGAFDSHNTPNLDLPQWGLSAALGVDFPADEKTSHHGIYVYIHTNQVGFRDANRAWRNLESIPRILFSEVMRDIDLFVGVTSVMNDPQLGAQEDQSPLHTYWRTSSFGDLSASASTRRELLERMLPKLAIADRCCLEDRFLIVRGDRAAYKIHLGSGNVIVEPGSRYLCIVPGSGPSNLFLPFEGDQTFTMILSKAFLLAADSKIKEPSILSQLKQAWTS